MPAALISSGPSASKRRCSLPPAISSAQAARPLGVNSLAGELTTSRQRLAQAAATFACSAVSPAAPAAGPQRTRRSIWPRLSSVVFQRPFSYGPSTVPSTSARPCSSGGSPSSSTIQAMELPPTSSVRAAILAAAVRSRSASRVRFPRPTAATRAAARRPSVCRSATWPSSPLSSPASWRRVRRPSTSRSRPSAAPDRATGSRTAKARTSAPTPPGGASTTSICMSEAGSYPSGRRGVPLPR